MSGREPESLERETAAGGGVPYQSGDGAEDGRGDKEWC
jgi:hypothetical protein